MTRMQKGLGAYGVGTKQVRIAIPVTTSATPEAAHWQGWGTALKPTLRASSYLHIKPFAGSIVENVLGHGTGALKHRWMQARFQWWLSDRSTLTQPELATSNFTGQNTVEIGQLSPTIDGLGRWPSGAVSSMRKPLRC